MTNQMRISKRSALASPYAQLSNDELARVFDEAKAKYRMLLMLTKIRKQEVLNEIQPVQAEQEPSPRGFEQADFQSSEPLNVAQPQEPIQPDNIQQETPTGDAVEQDMVEHSPRGFVQAGFQPSEPQQEIFNINDLQPVEDPQTDQEPSPRGFEQADFQSSEPSPRGFEQADFQSGEPTPTPPTDEIQPPENNDTLHSQPDEVINNISAPVINNSDEDDHSDDDHDCPVCTEHLQHGFATCPNNHRVCFSCFMNDLVKTCPMCRYDYHKPAINNEALQTKIEDLNEEIALLRDENTELRYDRETIIANLSSLQLGIRRYPPTPRQYPPARI
jgi:hypothetical protein